MEQLVSIISNTYLIERLIGVGAYAFLVVVAYYSIRQSDDYFRLASTLNIVIIILTIMAFFFVPDESKDLTRILAVTDSWVNRDFSYIYKHEILNSMTPVGAIYLYLCRMTGITGLLPALTSFLFYLNIFSVLKNMKKHLQSDNRDISMVFLFFMSGGCFLELISDIKCFLAFSIIIRCVFSETMLNKSIIRNVILYIIAALMHSAAIPLIVIRFIMLIIFERKQSVLRKIIEVFCVLAFITAGFVLLSNYIQASFTKATGYITEDRYSYSWEYLIGIIQLLFVIYTLLYYRKLMKGKQIPLFERNIVILSISLLIVELCLCFEYNIFHRFVLVSTMLISPIIVAVMKDQREKGRVVYYHNALVISELILLLACARGNLCGYKFFIL